MHSSTAFAYVYVQFGLYSNIVFISLSRVLCVSASSVRTVFCISCHHHKVNCEEYDDIWKHRTFVWGYVRILQIGKEWTHLKKKRDLVPLNVTSAKQKSKSYKTAAAQRLSTNTIWEGRELKLNYWDTKSWITVILKSFCIQFSITSKQKHSKKWQKLSALIGLVAVFFLCVFQYPLIYPISLHEIQFALASLDEWWVKCQNQMNNNVFKSSTKKRN